jgi:hypothetical protein
MINRPRATGIRFSIAYTVAPKVRVRFLDADGREIIRSPTFVNETVAFAYLELVREYARSGDVKRTPGVRGTHRFQCIPRGAAPVLTSVAFDAIDELNAAIAVFRDHAVDAPVFFDHDVASAVIDD